MSIAATVTIPYAEFQSIQDARCAAENKVGELQNQIRQAKIEASDQVMLVTARAAIEIARYAVASLPAESNKGWPSQALRVVAVGLPLLPDTTQDDKELATTFEYFANEIDLYERRRRGLANSAITEEVARRID